MEILENSDSSLIDSPQEEESLVEESVRKYITYVRYCLSKRERFDNDELTRFVSTTINLPGWQREESINTSSKAISKSHILYWRFASWNVWEDWDYILDENWIPKNFTFLLNWWGNLVRLNWWNIHFTPSSRK